MRPSTSEFDAIVQAIRQQILEDQAHQGALAAEDALRRWPHSHELLNLLGAALARLGRVAEAEQALRSALAINMDYAPALSNLGTLLADHDELEAAEPFLARAVRLQPSPRILARLATLVPPLPESTAQIDRQRAVTAGRIADLHARNVRIDVTSTLAIPMFYLPYHGRNDRDLQREAAKLYVAPQPTLQPRQRRSRIRIGFISNHFRDHTIGRLNAGLIANLSREQFEVIVFTTPAPHDDLAKRIQASADEDVVLPVDLAAARDAVVQKNLDVLFYTDVGMESVLYTLAMSRLAPVQCATWGHPTTTGIPTIDYFISADALEIPQGDEHYTERLIRLKNLAVCYERPPRASANRGRFGFDPGTHLYVCPQTPYKFHPDFDPVIAAILRRDPRGRLVLIDTHSRRHWTQKLMERWQGTIPDVLGQVIVLPAHPRDDFLALLATADVLLDPLHFGGGNTSYEAFAMGTPIVTLPSQFLRGRITSALYQAMGVTDCIADSSEHYIELANAVAGDRSEISHKIDAASPQIFANPAGVRDLEALLTRVIDA